MAEKNVWQFTVPGNPVPWTVWTRRGPAPEGYLRMEAWQAQINAYTKQYWNGPDGPKEPIAGPVRLKMDFYLPWPKSAPKKSPDAINRWLLKNYPKRSDIRNMAKAFEDALQTIVYQNDNQVIVAGPDTKGFTTRGEGYTVCTVEKLIPTGV